MWYVIAAIFIILCLLILGYLTKKKYFREVDRLERWKIDIMNRPIPDELSKVKQLNMTGQTELLFDGWRKDWDEIVATELPDVEEALMDAEEFIDKYRFRSAGAIHKKIDDTLKNVEGRIKLILSELNELVGSEQKNREEVEKLKEQYRECKKTLFAHRHSFATAAEAFEEQLEALVDQFIIFEEKTENGNYLDAREIVLTINETIAIIINKMEKIPQLFVDLQTGIPLQLSEIKSGYHEMAEHGYHLEHLNIKDELQDIELRMSGYLELLAKTEVNEVESGIDSIRERIELLYNSLEQEVNAKHFIQKEKDETKTLLEEATDASQKLKKETDIVLITYHLHEKELAAQKKLEKELAQLIKRHEQLELKISQANLADSLLASELEEVRGLLQSLRTDQELYHDTLQALRKDELAAREKIVDLKLKVREIVRTISKSKLPGLSQEYEYLFDDTAESIDIVMDKLAEKPLDIPTVQHYLEAAISTVEKLVTETDTLLETVVLAEKVIQYGNRYKSSNPSVAMGLHEAEIAFRSYDYKTALETAVMTIEKVEPDAIKKIEEMLAQQEAY